MLPRQTRFIMELVLRNTSTNSVPENGLLVKELISVAHQVNADRIKLFTCVSRVAQSTAVCGIQAWERMRSGASRLMQKYAVQTCGYCSEVQVGPKDHQSEKPLVNDLKKYYGMLPAVVELFAQAGACVPKCYVGMMREDVMVSRATVFTYGTGMISKLLPEISELISWSKIIASSMGGVEIMQKHMTMFQVIF
ncbi:hypothetical protein V6N13_069960 [Hibiscus sabdariffa]